MDAIPHKVLILLRRASQEKDLNFEEIKSKIFIGNRKLYKIYSLTILGIYLITLFILQLAVSGLLYLEIGVKLGEL